MNWQPSVGLALKSWCHCQGVKVSFHFNWGEVWTGYCGFSGEEWDRMCAGKQMWARVALCTSRRWGWPFWVVVHGHSAVPMGARWDGKTWNIGNKTSRHVQTHKIGKLAKLGWFVQTQAKCVLVRQVMESVYCAPARRLKMYWMALLSLTNRWGTWNIKQNETYSDIFKLKNVCMCVKQVNWLRGDCVLKLKQNGWWRGR